MIPSPVPDQGIVRSQDSTERSWFKVAHPGRRHRGNEFHLLLVCIKQKQNYYLTAVLISGG